jgi:hypothetical protein
MRRAVFLLGISWIGFACAQPVPGADLETTLVAPDGIEVGPDRPTRSIIRLRNLGPDTSLGHGAGVFYFISGPDARFVALRLPETEPCTTRTMDFVPSRPNPAALSTTVFRTAPLAPGAAGDCVMGVQSFRGVVRQPLAFLMVGGPIGELDPSPGNDRPALNLIVGTVPAPVPSLGQLDATRRHAARDWTDSRKGQHERWRVGAVRGVIGAKRCDASVSNKPRSRAIRVSAAAIRCPGLLLRVSATARALACSR